MSRDGQAANHGQGLAGSKAAGVKKRRAVPPGLLQYMHKARQTLSIVGLSDGLSRGSGMPPACSGAYVRAQTLPVLFQQRKLFLQRHKAKAGQHADEYQRREGEGLLSLPEDVLLKIVCLLSHDEVKPLFQVCKPLHATLKAAVREHYNFNTPSRTALQTRPPVPRPNRQRKRAEANIEEVISKQGGRTSRGTKIAAAGRSRQSPTAQALRALSFAESSKGLQAA